MNKVVDFICILALASLLVFLSAHPSTVLTLEQLGYGY